MMRRGTWVSIFVMVVVVYCGNIFANDERSAAWYGNGMCGVKVDVLQPDHMVPTIYLQEIFDHNMKITNPVRLKVPQPSFQACLVALEYECAKTKWEIYYPSFKIGMVLGKAEMIDPNCYTLDSDVPDPVDVPQDTYEYRYDEPYNNLNFNDLPTELQPGWLYQHLPRSLSDVINLERLVNWFDGFMGEVLRALDEMKRTGGYWLEHLSAVLLKILVVSVIAALVLLLTPASALAGLAQLAAVALLIVSILSASGIQFDSSKITPSWQSRAFLDVKFDVQNNLRQSDEGMLAGNVSVSYTVMENKTPQDYKIYFASNNGRIDFYMQKNKQKTLEKTWQMPGLNDNRQNLVDR